MCYIRVFMYVSLVRTEPRDKNAPCGRWPRCVLLCSFILCFLHCAMHDGIRSVHPCAFFSLELVSSWLQPATGVVQRTE